MNNVRRFSRPSLLLLVAVIIIGQLVHLPANVRSSEPAAEQATWPTPIINTGLQLRIGTTVTISPQQLDYSAPNVAPENIGYFLEAKPLNGTLRLATGAGTTKALVAGDAFTQADILAGHVSYTHNGTSPSTDSFRFRLQSVYRASVSSNRAQTNQDAICADIADTGRYVAFYSGATNLVAEPSDTNGAEDVFVHDRLENKTILASVGFDGTIGDGGSSCLALSANGRFVVFQSRASNLVPDDYADGYAAIYLRDLINNTTQRLIQTIDGQPLTESLELPAISSDGNIVVFQSASNNLVEGDTNGVHDIFIHNRQLNKTERISVGPNGTQGDGFAIAPAISANGRYVTFISSSANLVANDNNGGTTDIFLYDVQEKKMSLVSLKDDGTQAPTGTFGVHGDIPVISADGNIVAFTSRHRFTATDTNDQQFDVFVRDRSANTTTLVSAASSISGGQAGNSTSSTPSISANGRYIVFTSDASNLVPGDTNGVTDVFRHDLQTGETIRVSVNARGGQLSGPSLIDSESGAGISADGSSVVFASTATDLVAGDSNTKSDVFVAEIRSEQQFTISAAGSEQLALSPIQSQKIFENTTLGPLNFNLVAPAPQSVQLLATSSNQELIPDNSIVLAGSGTQRSITITPLPTDARSFNTANRVGTALISIQATDMSGIKVTTSFQVVVEPPPWLVMLYLAGDDIDRQSPNGALDRSLYEPINDLESRLNTMPYNPAMRLVVLIDGNEQLVDGRGDSRVKVRERDAWVDVTTSIIEGGPWFFPPSRELDTGSPTTLRNFIAWSRNHYQGATYSMLALVDHGGGWAPDTDDAVGQPLGRRYVQAGSWRGMSLDLTSPGGSSLSTRDTGEALDGLTPFDVIFLDACSMSMIESAYEIRNAAQYMIAGQNLLFAELPYDDYLNAEALGATTQPEQLARSIVARYNTGDGVNSSTPFTIGALHLARLRQGSSNNVAQRVNELSNALLMALPATPTSADPLVVALQDAYRRAQKFDYDSSLTLDANEGYVDLGHFASLLATSSSTAVSSGIRQAAQAVATGVSQTGGLVLVHRNVSGDYDGQPWDFANARGISIYLPLGERDYRPTAIDPSNIARPLRPERQLGYYVNTCPSSNGNWQPCPQLAFTRSGAAPRWGELLVRLEGTVNTIRAIEQVPGLQSLDQLSEALQYNYTEFQSPAQILPGDYRPNIYLPLLRR